jgi:hypothetical protein
MRTLGNSAARFPTICRRATRWSAAGNSRGANEQTMARTFPWKVSDEWWRQVEPTSPPNSVACERGPPAHVRPTSFCSHCVCAANGYSSGSGCRWSQSPRLQAALCHSGWDRHCSSSIEPRTSTTQHLCLDAGYDSPLMPLLVRARSYLDHIRSRGQEKAAKGALPGGK